MPRDSTAAFLLSQWQELEGRQTPLSETSLARLRVAIDKWVKQPSAKAAVARVKALRDWHLERAEHPVAEVAAWLDEIAAIHPGPLAFAIRGDTLVGATLSAQRQASLKFGPAAENGLRAAWSRYPARDTYLLGDVISTSFVIQNVSERTVEFECPHSLENIVTWEAKTDDGRTIEAKLARLHRDLPALHMATRARRGRGDLRAWRRDRRKRPTRGCEQSLSLRLSCRQNAANR